MYVPLKKYRYGATPFLPSMGSGRLLHKKYIRNVNPYLATVHSGKVFRPLDFSTFCYVRNSKIDYNYCIHYVYHGFIFYLERIDDMGIWPDVFPVHLIRRKP